MNIVVANVPGILDNGQEVIPFPSRWCSGIPKGQRAPFKFYPYELAGLSTLLKRELPHATVRMIDPNIDRLNGDQTIQAIAALKPDVLICECSALTYPTMTRVMQTVASRAYGHVRTILCGPMAGYEPECARKDGWTDCVKGEYELAVLELLGGTAPNEARVNGLVNLDWLPWPEDEDLDITRYREINHYIDYRSNAAFLQVYLSRGCPLSCTFCTVPLYYGGHGKSHKSHRTRNIDDVCEQLTYLVYKYPNTVGFYANEEVHNSDPEWVAALCEELIRRGLNRYQFDVMSGMWAWSKDLIQLAKRAGYRQIRFGLESTSEQVGKAIKKTLSRDRTETFLGWLKDAGVGAYATVQCGAMGSTEESDRATIADVKDWIRQGKIQKWQYSTSTPQIGTPFWDLCKKNGYFVTENPEDFDGYKATCNFPGYSAAQIQRVRDTAGL